MPTLNLDLILANACPDEINVGGDSSVSTYRISTHCLDFLVTAQLIKVGPDIRFRVIEYKTEVN